MKTDLVYGIHAVNALLKNSRDNILELYVLRGRHDKRLHNLLSRCKGIPQSHKNRNELNDIASSEQHQGIIALIRADGDMKSNLIAENDIENRLSAL
ncbi:MAG: RNA methyltransferase substrate-binding domain-containing protein, partial [Gammaproteobacteria bacterium]